MTDTLLADAQSLENLASACLAALAQAKADAATAAASQAAAVAAHAALVAAIGTVVTDAEALDPSAAPPAPPVLAP